MSCSTVIVLIDETKRMLSMVWIADNDPLLVPGQSVDCSITAYRQQVYQRLVVPVKCFSRALSSHYPVPALSRFG